MPFSIVTSPPSTTAVMSNAMTAALPISIAAPPAGESAPIERRPCPQSNHPRSARRRQHTERKRRRACPCSSSTRRTGGSLNVSGRPFRDHPPSGPNSDFSPRTTCSVIV